MYLYVGLIIQSLFIFQLLGGAQKLKLQDYVFIPSAPFERITSGFKLVEEKKRELSLFSLGDT